MGKIIYDGEVRPIIIDDRALAHLKVVIATKLRRHESFTLTWQHETLEPGARSTVWLHPSIPLQFVFDDPVAPQLNGGWIEQMMHEVNSTGDITLAGAVIEPKG